MIDDIPTVCDRGTKCNAQGYKISWNDFTKNSTLVLMAEKLRSYTIEPESTSAWLSPAPTGRLANQTYRG